MSHFVFSYLYDIMIVIDYIFIDVKCFFAFYSEKWTIIVHIIDDTVTSSVHMENETIQKISMSYFIFIFPGFSVVSASRIFHILMDRLGHKKYYVQGGDWGSVITTIMAQTYSE